MYIIWYHIYSSLILFLLTASSPCPPTPQPDAPMLQSLKPPSPCAPMLQPLTLTLALAASPPCALVQQPLLLTAGPPRAPLLQPPPPGAPPPPDRPSPSRPVPHVHGHHIQLHDLDQAPQHATQARPGAPPVTVAELLNVRTRLAAHLQGWAGFRG